MIGVWINSAGLNNLGRPKFKLGSAHEKFGVWTGPKIDQLQISPCNITALYNRVVMRIEDMITEDTNKWELEFWCYGSNG